MFALFARSICAHCLPGPSSTQEPSLPSLSPSLIISSVPTIGLLSLAVTFLFFARLTVPTGTRKSGRLAFVGRSRLVTLRGRAFPQREAGAAWSSKELCPARPQRSQQAARSERQDSSPVFSSLSQAFTSSGVMASLVCAATASFALWIVYSLLKASSPGQF